MELLTLAGHLTPVQETLQVWCVPAQALGYLIPDATFTNMPLEKQTKHLTIKHQNTGGAILSHLPGLTYDLRNSGHMML